MERLGECCECEEQDVPVFTEVEGLTRDYCKNCMRTCLLCGGFCDKFACYDDEGEQDFPINHDCHIDGKETCGGSDSCKYRYCLICTKKCPSCDFNIIEGNAKMCTECHLEDDIPKRNILKRSNDVEILKTFQTLAKCFDIHNPK